MAFDRRKFLISGGATLLNVGGFNGIAKAASVKQSIDVAVGGDCVIMRPLSILNDKSFLQVADLFRTADIGFANCETVLHDYEGYPAPAKVCGDLNLRTDPAIARELSWFGLNMMSTANNHAGDYGHEGLLSTIKYLQDAGIVTSGAGTNLTMARKPGFRNIAKGRVALVSCASTFREGSQAGPGHAAIHGRPGLSPLRVTNTYRLRPEQLQQLKGIRQELMSGMFRWPDDPSMQAGSDSVQFTGDRFAEGDKAEIVIQANPDDIAQILAQVKRARAEADVVMVSIHTHEAGLRREDPPSFLMDFARTCIDGGADIFIGHGPLSLRGIELYKNKPIFYSVGSLFFQPESMDQIPAEIYQACGIEDISPSSFFNKVMPVMLNEAPYWESVIPRVSFENGVCRSIELHPIDLGWKLPSTVRGTPRLAKRKHGREILEKLSALSAPFGTEIQVNRASGSVLIP